MNHLIAALLDRSVSILGATVALMLFSVLLGAVLAIVFGWISPQARVKAVKRKIGAAILEAILYRHDTRVSLNAQGRLLGLASWYLLLAVPPIVVLMLPTLFFMGHLNELFGYRLPGVGERMLVVAQAEKMPSVDLQTSGSLAATPALHIPSENSVVWRLDRTNADAATLSIVSAASERTSFDLFGTRLSPLVSSHWWQRLLFPATAAPALPASLVQVSFGFPARYFRFVGHDFSWITIFLILSLVSGYITARLRGIAI